MYLYFPQAQQADAFVSIYLYGI